MKNPPSITYMADFYDFRKEKTHYYLAMICH